MAALVGELAQDLGEVGGALFLQEVEEIGGRTYPLQSLDRVEHHVDSAVERHRPVVRGAVAAESRRKSGSSGGSTVSIGNISV